MEERLWNVKENIWHTLDLDNTMQSMHTVTYQSEETYVHEAKILWSSDQSPNGKIGPGTFNLSFQFEIPKTV